MHTEYIARSHNKFTQRATKKIYIATRLRAAFLFLAKFISPSSLIPAEINLPKKISLRCTGAENIAYQLGNALIPFDVEKLEQQCLNDRNEISAGFKSNTLTGLKIISVWAVWTTEKKLAAQINQNCDHVLELWRHLLWTLGSLTTKASTQHAIEKRGRQKRMRTQYDTYDSLMKISQSIGQLLTSVFIRFEELCIADDDNDGEENTRGWELLALGFSGAACFALRSGFAPNSTITSSSIIDAQANIVINDNFINVNNIIDNNNVIDNFIINASVGPQQKQKGRCVDRLFIAPSFNAQLELLIEKYQLVDTRCPTKHSLSNRSFAVRPLFHSYFQNIFVPAVLFTNQKEIPKHRLVDSRVLRRIYVTLVHLLYVRRLLEASHVVTLAHFMCHTVKEALTSYNVLPSMFSLFGAHYYVTALNTPLPADDQLLRLAEEIWTALQKFLKLDINCETCGKDLQKRDWRTHKCYHSELVETEQ